MTLFWKFGPFNLIWFNCICCLPARLSLSSVSPAHSGRLPVRVGLGARDAAPRPGGEGPQGARSHQLAAPPARRQARTADILPLCMRPGLRSSRASGFHPALLCFWSLDWLGSRPSRVTRRHGAQLGCRRLASGFPVSRTSRSSNRLKCPPLT